MLLNDRISWAVVLGLLPGPASPAHAGLITYAFSGTGPGQLDATAFTDAAFRVTIRGDTADILLSLLGPTAPVLVDLTAEIVIDGPGGATFANPVHVFSNQDVQIVGFGDYSGGDFQGDDWDQSSPAPAGYGLDISFARSPRRPRLAAVRVARSAAPEPSLSIRPIGSRDYFCQGPRHAVQPEECRSGRCVTPGG